jgi:uncharacterized protein
MPNYKSPGVYVEEIPSKSQTISGVGTSIAGFVGLVTEETKGGSLPPEYEAKSIANWGEFKNKFGDVQEGNKVLAYAVYGFFDNGGSRCWVARVTTLEQERIKEALTRFEAIDEISIVAVPFPPKATLLPAKPTAAEPRGTVAPNNLQQGVWDEVLAHCEKMKDRFAILDREDATEELKTSNDYGAVYFPYIKVRNQMLPAEDPDIYMPPSGHIAGVYARVDASRGVFKAPANEVIRGVSGEKQRPVSRIEQDALSDKNINVIRKFNGNTTVWGARTISANPEFKYINVRRTLLFLRESIDEGTQWAVFEPNNPALWQKIKRNVSDFLLVQWRAGALFGNTEREAFYVKCDSETNPPTEVALGKVIAEVGISIVRPAEFVIFRISQTTLPS